ncbi:HET-domain-containing protein [Lentinus tigrinus ALCF2SS1-7]|uniref:HET-domain-containing protein n=1 Tax=Lentinus tigrinus ALCF2SS1-7 TaxID=1328758 RepID=UPI0011661B3B|nr:HET-domain-containing protein [Lentinus tigrinus ALCF2SS1-7]
MWVLNTDRAELHFFASPEEVPGGYAALSHVWDEKELSFQDLQRIQLKCAKRFTKKGRNPRNFVSEKIRRCCELAASHGYKWVWIDTCCIDKTSSAELSEAINSMFRYYSLAGICYGYLRDVSELSTIAESIWFRRGWTLQELVAPRSFLFLSRTWQALGSRADFSERLEERIGIPGAVLRLEVSYADFSIAQRMSWFGERQTTRLEDEAYCLLGLFDIHMPPLYGEGRNAFRRLQEEIMKQSADTTLFAWDAPWLEDHLRSCLLAPSPSAFKGRDIVYTPPRCLEEAAPNDSTLTLVDNDMTFSVAPDGILAYILIIARGDETYGDLYWSAGDGSGQVLLRLEADSTGQARSSRRPSYRVCFSKDNRSRLHWEEKLSAESPGPYSSWQTVLLRHRPSPHWFPYGSGSMIVGRSLHSDLHLTSASTPL